MTKARPKRFDTTKIPSTYVIEVKNKFELLNTAEKMRDEQWQGIQSAIIETADRHIP